MCVRVCCMCVRAQLVLSTFKYCIFKKKEEKSKEKKKQNGQKCIVPTIQYLNKTATSMSTLQDILLYNIWGLCSSLVVTHRVHWLTQGVLGSGETYQPLLWPMQVLTVWKSWVYLFVSVCYRWLSLCAVKKEENNQCSCVGPFQF